MSKKKTTVVAMSQTNIDRLAKTESEFQKLKGERADAYNSIQEKKARPITLRLQVSAQGYL